MNKNYKNLSQDNELAKDLARGFAIFIITIAICLPIISKIETHKLNKEIEEKRYKAEVELMISQMKYDRYIDSIDPHIKSVIDGITDGISYIGKDNETALSLLVNTKKSINYAINADILEKRINEQDVEEVAKIKSSLGDLSTSLKNLTSCLSEHKNEDSVIEALEDIDTKIINLQLLLI